MRHQEGHPPPRPGRFRWHPLQVTGLRWFTGLLGVYLLLRFWLR